MHIKKLIALFILLTALPVFGGQPDDVGESHKREIRQLIRSQISPDYLDDMYFELSGEMAIYFQAEIQPSLERPLSESEQQRLRHFWYKKIKDLMPYTILEDILVPVVAKYLTYEEVVKINHFYNTPVGKKLTSLLPIMTREAEASGEEIGRKLADTEWQNSVMEELKDQFPHWFPDK